MKSDSHFDNKVIDKSKTYLMYVKLKKKRLRFDIKSLFIATLSESTELN